MAEAMVEALEEVPEEWAPEEEGSLEAGL